MKKILLVYFSATGFTGRIAKEIGDACNADIDRIPLMQLDGKSFSHHTTSFKWTFGTYLRAVMQAMLHRKSAIYPMKYWPEDYDLVVIGTPVWCWNIASPVRTYLNLFPLHTKDGKEPTQVAFFCTCGGAGAQKVFRDLANLTRQTPIATLALTDDEINKGQYQEKITAFSDQLKFPDRLPVKLSFGV